MHSNASYRIPETLSEKTVSLLSQHLGECNENRLEGFFFTV